MPSQSSSSPLHTSGAGPMACVHVNPLGPGPVTTMPFIFAHAYFAVQVPSVSGTLLTPVQGEPNPATSSIAPLQSSSTPLQVSGDLATPPTHTRMSLALAPGEHWYVPDMQRVPATPLVAVLVQSARFPVGQQAWLSHGSVRWSSITPSQSSSLPLHTSAAGPTEPAQPSTPPVHAVRPALHCPMQFATLPPGQLAPQTMLTSVR